MIKGGEAIDYYLNYNSENLPLGNAAAEWKPILASPKVANNFSISP